MHRDDQVSTHLRWGVGCLVAAAAMTGLVILLMYIAFTFDLPVWAQIMLGVGLTIGGGLLSWLVFAALSQRGPRTDPPVVTAVPDEDHPFKGG